MAHIYGEPGAVVQFFHQVKDNGIHFSNKTDFISCLNNDRRREITSLASQYPSLFLGAKGEARVSRQLSRLPDDFTIIHDYNLEFTKPLHDRQNDDYIFSIQIDHLVIGPTGIFLIETKHWSKTSQENRNFFSPIRQVKRSNFALFVKLNQAIEKGSIVAFGHHWGLKQISPQNILCFIKHAPSDKFQHVTILSPDQLSHHILNRKRVFNPPQIHSLVDYILNEESHNPAQDSFAEYFRSQDTPKSLIPGPFKKEAGRGIHRHQKRTRSSGCLEFILFVTISLLILYSLIVYFH